MQDLVSIIVPVYKTEKYIHRCIDSIINQTYTDIEIILVDDGSPDDCGKICDTYSEKDSRVKVIHKSNAGVGEARNTGIEESTGQYIMFVDSDDWLELNAVEVLYKAKSKYKCDLVFASSRSILKDRMVELPYESKFFCGVEIAENLIYIHKRINVVWCCLFDANVIKGNSLKFKKIPVGEDSTFDLEYINTVDKIVIIADIIYNYNRISETSIMNKVNAKMNVYNFVIYEAAVELIKRKVEDKTRQTELISMFANFSFMNSLDYFMERIKEEKLLYKKIKELVEQYVNNIDFTKIENLTKKESVYLSSGNIPEFVTQWKKRFLSKKIKKNIKCLIKKLLFIR